VLAAACACALGLAWREWDRARTDRDRAIAAHGTVMAQAREVAELRREAQTLGERPSPQQDLVARLEACAAPLGLGPKPVADLRGEAPQEVPSTPFHKQRVTVTMNPLRPADLARFVHAWRTAEPLWTIASVRMDRERDGGGSGGGGGSAAGRAGEPNPRDRFRVTLTLENIHLAEPSGPASGRAPAATEVVDTGARR
jgi:hypothetical protein